MRSFWRAVLAAVVIAIIVAVVAWATAPDDHTVPPTIVPVMGERPATFLPPAVDVAPDYAICGQVGCAVP